MKRLFPLLLSVLTLLSCLFVCSCGGGENYSANTFMYFSVRLKGGGDGTVTAVAQNEFSIGSARFPVSLKIYKSDSFETDTDKMTELESCSAESLDIFQSLVITVSEGEGFYCAVLQYDINGKIGTIQSDTLGYNSDGKRIK